MDKSWNGNERRSRGKSAVKDKVFEAIQNSDDQNLKAILALMYGSLEYTDDAIHRIEAKLDAIRQDESTIKKQALNGYAEKHHLHHEWIDRNEQRILSFIEKAEPLLDWMETHKAEQEELAPVCNWARETMESTIEARKDKKYIFMKFLGGAVNHIGTALATLIMAWVLWGPK